MFEIEEAKDGNQLDLSWGSWRKQEETLRPGGISSYFVDFQVF